MKNWRVNSIFTVFFLIVVAIISRLVFLQILNGDFYKALSQGLHISFTETSQDRGEIFSKEGRPFAINIDWPFVFTNPQKIKNTEETVKLLSETLGFKEEFVLEKLSANTSYSLLKRKLTEEEFDAVGKLDINGVYLGREKGRYYPQEALSSHIIGFLGAEGFGQYGLEESYNDILSQKDGFTENKKGSDLFLTIDYNIQFEAERLLQKAKEDIDIKKGQILVLEPNSGKVLAMADLLSFDPNHYEDYARKGNLEVFKNRASQELFEPGSVFKAVTMAAALEEEKVSPKTTYIDKGSVKINNYTIYNYEQRIYEEPQTMTNVLEKSINTGVIFVQKQLGQNLFLKYIEDFGFFEPTGIDIQETYSTNKELKTGREINLATASFGQGIEITPIQLMRAYCAIANGGKLVTPYLVEKSIDSENIISLYEEENDKRIISSKTASQLTAMLVSVIENGFGKKAKIPGYFIAGKTGTAQVSFGALGIDKAGYSDKTIQSFIGFAPAFNPQFLVLVKLDDPKTKTAEYSATPIFKELTEYIINYYQIPPDYE